MIRILCRRSGVSQPESISVDRLETAIQDSNNIVWIDMCLSDESVPKANEFLIRHFAFHPLAIEDALLETHLSRVDDWQKYLYISFHSLEYLDQEIKQQELDVFLGGNYLITIHFNTIAPLQKLWEQVEKNGDARHMQSPDRLFYSLLDKITTATMDVVERLDDAMDGLEQEIYTRPRRDHLQPLFRIRRTVMQLRRIFGSQRETMNRLARDAFGVIHPENRVYFRDIYDHLVRMHELSDGLRDMASGALESHISVTSYRMNEVMKTLTIVTVLFMPLTFITGYFGMNFFGEKYNIDNPLGSITLFVLCMALMCLTPVIMLWWMARRGWLRSQLSARTTEKL